MNLREAIVGEVGEAGLQAVLQKVAATLVAKVQEGDPACARLLAEHLAPDGAAGGGLAERLQEARERREARKAEPNWPAEEFRTLWLNASEEQRRRMIAVAAQIGALTIQLTTGVTRAEAE